MTTPRAILTGIPNKSSRPLVLPQLPKSVILSEAKSYHRPLVPPQILNSVIPSEARDPYPLPAARGFWGPFHHYPLFSQRSSTPIRLPLLCLLLAVILLPAPGRNAPVRRHVPPGAQHQFRPVR